MNTYNQIQASFWQNAFVLDLTPEEKYFYIYLITNTKTTACGIYRFNLKLAVLETGFSGEVINNYLSSFESSGKIAVSKTTGEIMIVNWLKHNSKRNKRIIGQINSELKEVKDKELLKRFYESCRNREYPVEEIFKGVILPSEAKAEQDNVVQAIQEADEPQETDTAAASGTKAEEGKETQEFLFTTIKPPSAGKRRGKAKEKQPEEIEVYEKCGEDDEEQAVKGTPVMTWSFNDSGGALSSLS